MDFRKDIINRLQRSISDRSIDYLLLCTPENFCYVTGVCLHGVFGYGVVVIPRYEEPVAIVPEPEVARVKNSWISKMRSYKSFRLSEQVNPTEELLGEIKKIVRNCEGKIAIDSERLSASFINAFEKVFRSAMLMDFSRILSEMRMVKYEEEIQILCEVAEIADAGLQVTLENCRQGATEIELAAKIEYAMKVRASKKRGFWARSCYALVASGPMASAYSFSFPINRVLEKGDLVVTDIGGQLQNGYTWDAARTRVVSYPSEKQREVLNLTLEAEQKGISAAKPGVPVSEVYYVMNNVFAEAGYGQYGGPLWWGHGIGLAHEAPYIAPFDNTVLRENMVLCIEPSLWIPNFGGIAVEDMVVVTSSGAKRLTKAK